ncbi:MAG TPA: hypothetical protein VKN74_07990 [Candidatus Mcinerneyibacterium sp.]|nr:hypothetical protein [Candidatus Mcinerneyibacterium sp.]
MCPVSNKKFKKVNNDFENKKINLAEIFFIPSLDGGIFEKFVEDLKH